MECPTATTALRSRTHVRGFAPAPSASARGAGKKSHSLPSSSSAANPSESLSSNTAPYAPALDPAADDG